MLGSISSDSDSGEEKDEETEDTAESAQKKARTSRLHENYNAPLSFISGAVESGENNYNIKAVGEPFGNDREAYARPCYEEITLEIKNRRKEFRSQKKAATLFVIGGSAGIGKSTFLAYFVVRMKKVFKTIALCYASKSNRGRFGYPSTDDVVCVVWKNGEQQFKGTFGAVKERLTAEQGKLDLILMDGCSMPFVDAEVFKGTILISTWPSLFVKNLKNEIFNHCTLFMPEFSESEALSAAQILGVNVEVVKENLFYMNGIARYLFEPNAAKQNIQNAVLEVSVSGITNMVSMLTSDRREQLSSVYSLVLWKVDRRYTDWPKFELVSWYAEQLVAKKLMDEDIGILKNAGRNLAPLSGAEGYAGALFEAYAIRTIQTGGEFKMRSLEDRTTLDTLKIPSMQSGHIVVAADQFMAAPHHDPIIPEDGSTAYLCSPCLLQPSATDTPLFNCFFFGTDGRVFPLRITIAQTHKLHYRSAADAKQFLDRLLKGRRSAKYPLVFVVPSDMCNLYEKQIFANYADQQPGDCASSFDQWVIGL